MTGYFITGTDTDAGKTHVSCALLMAAKSRGLRVAGYKPIESGCPNSSTAGPDARALAAAAGTGELTSYTLTPPVSPHLAARQAGVHVELSAIVQRAEQLNVSHDFLIVEGAGGFLVPISDDETIADLAAALGMPTLIIAADRLGAINHSLLTIEAARRREISLAGLVLTEAQSGAGRGLENAETIAAQAKIPVFRLPHTSNPSQLAAAGGNLLSALLADAEAREKRV